MHFAAVPDEARIQKIYEMTPVKMQPYSLTSQADPNIWLPRNIESGIVASVTLMLESKIMQFIQKRAELKERIESSLEKLSCLVEWTNKEKVELKLKYKGTKSRKLIGFGTQIV